MDVLFVTGGRNIDRRPVVWRCLAEGAAHLGISPGLIIHGGARGVDAHAEAFAREHGIDSDVMHPDYEKFKAYPKAAPKARNTDLAERFTHAIALWDGQSTGTSDAIEKVIKREKPIAIYLQENPGDAHLRLLDRSQVDRLLAAVREAVKNRAKVRKQAKTEESAKAVNPKKTNSPSSSSSARDNAPVQVGFDFGADLIK